MNPEELVEGVSDVVSLPDVCIRVNEMVDNDRYSAVDIGEVILQDTGLTARMLRIVNSAFYNFPSRIDTVSRAITIIGIKDLRDLILATSAVDVFTKIPNELVDMGAFWEHSIYCAVVARELAAKCNVLHTERLFVAGMLHDVGKLVMYNRLPDQSRDALLVAGNDFDAIPAAEQEIMGFTHADVGAALVQQWKLPESLVACIRFHHDPQGATGFPYEAAIVHVANVLSNGAIQDFNLEDYISRIDPAAWEKTGIKENVLEQIIAEAGHQFSDACGVILPEKYRTRG